MPFAPLALKPGISKDETALATEGGWADGNRVRFRNSMPEAIGGWAPRTSTKFQGICRGAHDWVDLNGQRLLAYGTDTSLYALVGGAVIDITPPLADGTLAAPFTTVLGSNIVTVRHPSHSLKSGDSITFSNASPIAGIALNGVYAISRSDENSYTVVGPANATGDATSATIDSVDYLIPLPAGMTTGAAQGYGNAGYGAGPFGGTTGGDQGPRIWSMDNLGQNLIANPRGYGIFEWRPVFSAPETVLNGGFSAPGSWTTGGGWTIADGVANGAAGVASAISQLVDLRMEGGSMYRLSFDVVRNQGSVKFRVGAGLPTPVAADVGDTSLPITVSGSYSRLFRAPGGISQILFQKDASFIGSIENVSIRLESRAYRVKGAPSHVDWVFVDPARIVVAVGTQGFDGVYNPMLARWSDMEDIEDWTPTTTNASGELPLAGGARLMTGMPLRGTDILLSDGAAFQFQFTGTSAGFTQRLIGSGCGAIGRNAAVEWSGAAYWLSPNGFYTFSGGAPQKIPCPCEKFVLDALEPLQNEKIYAGVNPKYNEIWWLYADKNIGTECNRAIVYNFLEGVWSTHLLDRTCWISSGLFENPIAFSPTGDVFEHDVGDSANGYPLGWWIESGAMDLEAGQKLMMVGEIVPDVKDQAGEVEWSVQCRMYPNGRLLPADRRITSFATQTIRLRREGRQVQVRISSGATHSRFRMGAVKIDLRPLEAEA